MDSAKNAFKKCIREVPDFPKKGILFYDITTLLADKKEFNLACLKLLEKIREEDINPDKVVSIESRGFIFGAVLAIWLEAGFVPMRKPGKLPYKKFSEHYGTEYGKDAIEMHEDAINEGDKVLIVDDLLATGGTTLAAIKLIEKAKGKVIGCAYLIELNGLKGREKLGGFKVISLLEY